MSFESYIKPQLLIEETCYNQGCKGNVAHNVILSELFGKDKPQEKGNHSNNYDANADDYGTNYGEYAGSYAQDAEGYSDDVIDDAFDGDPDAYWNID